MIKSALPPRRIHLHLVLFAERIERDRARLHEPAAVENLARLVARRPADPGGLEVVHRAPDRIRDAPGHEPLVVFERRPRLLVAVRAQGAAGAVRVRRRHHHVRARDFRALLHQPRRLVIHRAVGAEQVAHHPREPRLAVVEHQAARVQIVMNVLRREGRKPADDVSADVRCDVARRRPGLEHTFRLRLRPQTGAGSGEQREKTDQTDGADERELHGWAKLRRDVEASSSETSVSRTRSSRLWVVASASSARQRLRSFAGETLHDTHGGRRPRLLLTSRTAHWTNPRPALSSPMGQFYDEEKIKAMEAGAGVPAEPAPAPTSKLQASRGAFLRRSEGQGHGGIGNARIGPHAEPRQICAHCAARARGNRRDLVEGHPQSRPR